MVWRELVAFVGARTDDVCAVLVSAATLGAAPIAGGRKVLIVGIGGFLAPLGPAAIPRYRLIVGVRGSVKLEAGRMRWSA